MSTTNLPSNSYIPKMEIDSTINRVYAVNIKYNSQLVEGDLYYSDDFGQTWIKNSTLPSDHVTNIYIKNHIVYVTTHGDGLLISTDGGTTWEQKTTANGLATNELTSVYVKNSTILLGGENGQASVSYDNGSHWENYGITDGLSGQSAAVFIGNDNSLFNGTFGEGLFYLPTTEKSWKRYSEAVAPTMPFIRLAVVWFSSIFVFIMLNQKWLKLTYIAGIAIQQKRLKQEKTN